MHHPLASRRTFLTTAICTTGLLTVPVLGQLSTLADQSQAFLRAVAAGDLTTVRSMLDAEPALCGARDEHDRSAFALALLHRHTDVAELLQTRGYQPDLHEAALALDWPRFTEQAQASPPAVNADHPIGGTAMYCAALGGAGPDIWRVYSQCGQPNARPNPTARSPLRAALEFHHLPTAELTAAALLGNGADPNLPELDRRSPLHVAARRGSAELIEMLIRKHAAVDAHDSDQLRAVDLAEREGHRLAADLLRDHHRIPRDHQAQRRAIDANGRPYRPPYIDTLPLSVRSALVGRSHTDINAVRAALTGNPLLAHSIATTTEGAVEAGAHMGRTDIVDLLLDHGAPYSLPTAVMRNDLATVRRALAEDPKRIYERGPHDFALLWYPVIGGGLIDMMQFLLDNGGDVQQQHHLGTTALHFAAMRGQIDIARLLIERGADVNRPGRKFNGTTHTPLMLARRGKHDRLARLLLDHGAVD